MGPLVAVGALVVLSVAQGAEVPKRHNSSDPKKCKRCSMAYERAVAHIIDGFENILFPARIVAGFLLLYDGRHPEQLRAVIDEAIRWREMRKMVTTNDGVNWYPALALLFLTEHFRHRGTDDARKAIEGLIEYLKQNQEPTGGWFKWTVGEGGRLSYPVRDLSMLTAIVYGSLLRARASGIRVPAGMLDRAEKCLLSNLSGAGISYGTGQRGPDRTGGRGAFALAGLYDAGLRQHRICTTYARLLPRTLPSLDKGHHVGGLHFLGVVLACYRLGPGAFARLTEEWLDRLIDRQDEHGGVYLGDDGASGGEKALFGGDFASTASFALLILGRRRGAFDPPRKEADRTRKKGRRRRSAFGPR